MRNVVVKSNECYGYGIWIAFSKMWTSISIVSPRSIALENRVTSSDRKFQDFCKVSYISGPKSKSCGKKSARSANLCIRSNGKAHLKLSPKSRWQRNGKATSQVVTGRAWSYPRCPQAGSRVEIYIPTAPEEVSYNMSTGDADWDDSFTLGCVKWNSNSHTATEIESLEAILASRRPSHEAIKT